MARLDTDRQNEIEPVRMEFAKEKLQELGIEITFENKNELRFEYKGELVRLFPFSGWHSGKSINDGRGIFKLINQLK